ncbi:MAG: hypothetical protein Q9174_001404 [Haloplaca sp. 1 TL-2023]
MANPTLTSTPLIVQNAQSDFEEIRLDHFYRRLQPTYDKTRLCIKVAATWEGLQACRKLPSLGIKTLATTTFSMQQAILAAEAGCAYVSPFTHELKTILDPTHDDGGANIILNQAIQAYYQQQNLATKVKAAGLLSVDEAKQLAGISSVTLAPDLLRELASTQELEDDLVKASIFKGDKKSVVGEDTNTASYLDDETQYREAFAKSSNGKGEWRMKQVDLHLIVVPVMLLTCCARQLRSSVIFS